MDDKTPQTPLVAISAIAVLFAALGVILHPQVPLKGVRPYTQGLQEPHQKIRARLWQDPFLAVLDKVKEDDRNLPNSCCGQCILTSRTITGEVLPDQIKKYLDRGMVTVLGVMVPGRIYDEDMESRVRYRSAVLSGLYVCGFIPEDPEHIGYLRIVDNPKAIGYKITLSDIVPIEWFHSRDTKRSVLLIWISHDAFPDKSYKPRPLSGLACLIDSLLSATTQGPPNKIPEFKIIAPADSDGLRDMVQELKDAKVQERKDAESSQQKDKICFPPSSSLDVLKKKKIYSAIATAPDVDILKVVGLSTNKTITKQFEEELNITFERTITNDEVLVGKLIDELARRGITPRDRIALIGEWDTFYGQRFLDIYKRALMKKINNQFESLEDKGRISDPKEIKWVESYRYMRGIDGKIPGETEKEAKKLEKKNEEIKEGEDKDISKLEEPSGKCQYDYLRRLAERIYRVDQQEQRKKFTGQPYKAFGIMGTDFCDKYLVLQALRQRFPERIFFTTDLDARLLQSDHIKWTRNLVVSSAYGFQLHKDLHGEAPPFRSSYQTSMFLATLKALDHKPLREFINDPPPHIYEIGRDKAYDLTVQCPEVQDMNLTREMPNINPWEIFFLSCLIISLTVIFMLIVYWFLSLTTREVLWQVAKSWKHLLSTAVLILGGIVAFYYIVLQNPGEEPFFLTGGVSIWPTEIIRLIALGLSWIFFLVSRANLLSNCKVLADEFGLSNCTDTLTNIKNVAPKASNTGKRFWKTLYEKVRDGWYEWVRYDWDWQVDPTDKGKFTVNKAWEAYIRNADWRTGLPYSAISFTIFYLILCFFIMSIFGFPTVPVRGDISGWLDFFILWSTIISFLFLTFFVLDSTQRCSHFVRMFLEYEPQWDEKFAPEGWGDEEELSYRMLLRLIVKHTEAVGKLIFYPVIIWFLLFVSRNPYFDNWHATWGLVIVISLTAIVAWGCAFRLRWSAERLRAEIIERLSKKLIRTYVATSDERESKINEQAEKKLKTLIDEVKAIQQGAFAPFFQHPVVRTLLVPLGGISGIKLLEFFYK